MLEQLVRQNRWWTSPAAINDDPHLRRLDAARLPWLPPLPFRFDGNVVYTLRGPRQVGKSTLLKRQIRELLLQGWPPRHLLYVDCELAGIKEGTHLVSALRGFLDEARLAGRETARLAIFLDEVTRVSGWAGGLRGLIDNGELLATTLLVTGSHTRDLREGGERLPGRRGAAAADFELLPMSFREYVRLRQPDLALPALASIDRVAVAKCAAELAIVGPVVQALFVRYLWSGGFPLAVNAEVAAQAVPPEVFATYRDAILGEASRAGLSETYLREIVNWSVRHRGQEFDWRGIAADTDIGTHVTARQYVEELASCYAWLVVYRASSLTDPAPNFRGPKKLHPLDPLLWHLMGAWASGEPDPWQTVAETMSRPEEVGRLVESVVVTHLRRAYGPRVFYWRAGGQEIDAVVPAAGVPRGRVLVEVKFQQRLDRADTAALDNAGGGLLLSRGEHGAPNATTTIVPVAYFLAGLAEATGLHSSQ